MANINKNETRKNIVELKRDLKTGFETLVIEGRQVGILGYVNEEDREAALAAIQKIVDNSKDCLDMMRQLQTLASLGDNSVDPDRQIEVDGYTCFISYAKKEAYDESGNKIADMNDLKTPNLPKEAVEAILTDRARIYFAGLNDDELDEDYDD